MRLLQIVLAMVVILFQVMLSEGYLEKKLEGILENGIQTGKLSAEGPSMIILKRVRRGFLTRVDDKSRVDVNGFNNCTISKKGKQLFKVCKNSKGKEKYFPWTRKARLVQEKRFHKG